jgi:hypothetical protein
MFGIQKDSKLISIEHINGNSWFTGFFSKEHERSSCLAAINKGSSDTGVRAAKLEESVKPSTHKKNMQTDTKKQQQFAEVQENQPLSLSNPKIKVKVLDIPVDFSYNRIKGALKRYGQISMLKINKEEKGKKSADILFNNITLDLENTWSIPMGEDMVRILPADHIHLISKRNSSTARLYGIHSNTTATRIMSAIKHMEAKSVYIPINGKTGKRRNFAIIGFKIQKV